MSVLPFVDGRAIRSLAIAVNGPCYAEASQGILRLRCASAKDGGGDAISARTEFTLILKGAYQSRLLAKAWPEPDFRWDSNASACALVEKDR